MLIHHIHKHLCVLRLKHLKKMLEYSYSGHESITIEFHKTFKKKVILYLILNKSTENTANCK